MAERKPPEFHRIIFDSLHEGLYSVDKNFKVTGFNRAAERITGYRRDEVLGRYCRHVFQTDRCVQALARRWVTACWHGPTSSVG